MCRSLLPVKMRNMSTVFRAVYMPYTSATHANLKTSLQSYFQQDKRVIKSVIMVEFNPTLQEANVVICWA